MPNARERLTALSPLSTDTARAHLLAVTAGSGTPTGIAYIAGSLILEDPPSAGLTLVPPTATPALAGVLSVEEPPSASLTLVPPATPAGLELTANDSLLGFDHAEINSHV